jgi:hypothetical protein
MKKRGVLFILLFFMGCCASKGYCENKNASVDKNGLGNKGSAEIVIVDCSNKLGPFKNIAAGINFWGEQEAQERFIREVGVSGLYRIMVVLDDVRKQGDAYKNFPWERRTKAEIDTLRTNISKVKAAGAKFMVEIHGIPKWLSMAPGDERIATNNLRNFAKYPPNDYREWQKLVTVTVKKLLDLGFDPHYYQIFAEQNVGSTWYLKDMPVGRRDGKLDREPNRLQHGTRRIMEEYCKLYEYTVQGIRAVDRNAKISGINFVPNMSVLFWTRCIAKYAREKGLPVDFYALQSYESGKTLEDVLKKKSALGEKQHKIKQALANEFWAPFKRQGFSEEEIQTFLDDALILVSEVDGNATQFPFTLYMNQIGRVLAAEGFKRDDLETFVTEWNAGHKGDERRDTHYCASLVVKSLIDMGNAGVDGQSFYSLWGWNRKARSSGFGKGTGYLFVPGEGALIPKPGFNALKLFSELKGQRLSVRSAKKVYGIATLSDNTLAAIVTIFDRAENPDYNKKKKIELVFENMPFQHYEYNVRIIDKAHANGFWRSGPELEVNETGTGEGGFRKTFPVTGYGTLMVVLKNER